MLEKSKITLQELKQQQMQIKNNVSLAKEELEKIMSQESVKRYIELSTHLQEIKEELTQLELDIFEKEKSTCEHIWITSTIEREFDGHRTDRFEYVSCIKCDLNEYDNKLYYEGFRDDKTTITHRIFQEPRKGIRTNIICDHDLAKGIYEGILRNHPDLSDEEIVRYLMTSIQEIKNREVTPEVAAKRTKKIKPQTKS